MRRFLQLAGLPAEGLLQVVDALLQRLDLRIRAGVLHGHRIPLGLRLQHDLAQLAQGLFVTLQTPLDALVVEHLADAGRGHGRLRQVRGLLRQGRRREADGQNGGRHQEEAGGEQLHGGNGLQVRRRNWDRSESKRGSPRGLPQRSRLDRESPYRAPEVIAV